MFRNAVRILVLSLIIGLVAIGCDEIGTTPPTDDVPEEPGDIEVPEEPGDTEEPEEPRDIEVPGDDGEEAGFVTGGGWIPIGKKKGNFGFNVKYEEGSSSLKGQLTYIDHSTKMKVKSETMSSLEITGNKATFTGDCKIDGVGGHTFTVVVVDKGEPGNNDTFNISLSDGYSAGSTLGGGNIVIHNE